MSDSAIAYSGPNSLTFATSPPNESDNVYSGPVQVPLLVEPPNEAEYVYSGPQFLPLNLSGGHESRYAYGFATGEVTVPTEPFDPGELPGFHRPVIVLRLRGPFGPIMRIGRVPTIAVDGDLVDFHWQELRVRNNETPPRILDTEQAELILVNMRAGVFGYRFSTRLYTGETAVQDFLVIAEDD